MGLPLLFGKSAIVTGAGSGIGRAICNILVRDGAKVIAADSDLQAAKETVFNMKSESATAMKLDVTNVTCVKNALHASKELFKDPPTIVVNSYAVLSAADLFEMENRDLDRVLKKNLWGADLMLHVFAESLMAHKLGGSIINISSVLGKLYKVGQVDFVSDEAAGVLPLTTISSKHFGASNIRINAVLPVYSVDTPMPKGILGKGLNAIQQSPIGRIAGRPDEVAEVVSYLSSEKASDTNGAFIAVNGDL